MNLNKEKTDKKYSDVFLTTTDTVVGIGVPVKANKLELLYELKNRDLSKKIIILVGSIEQAREFKEWNSKADEFAQKYWPGQVSLIVNNQGFRMPNQKGLLELLEKIGPCFVTSANLSGQAPLSIEEAQKVFSKVKKVYNFGVGTGTPSKIIRIEDEKELR
ncbi:L-threonylcarbamoyladenylate synthase [Mycoplasma procyoni]|uniref:L-threonylcarbamoyladenylate synthase n=1 Tax=Mycoplasma procyoni TaxID=568784 RepID=UPI00197CA3E7|nr:Sua5/YciO/YrdC/YwlC family protein [Mycoplasma procyoni]MBN3534925.1 Sua5/YciO/YrdC/YwlC family protein [Mycoplasma procyoni]